MLREASIGRARRLAMQSKDKLLPTSEALAYLAEVWGFKRSPITLWRWASEGDRSAIQKIRTHSNYYAPTDLDEFHAGPRLSPRKRSVKLPAAQQAGP